MQIYLFHIVSPNFPHTFFENVHIAAEKRERITADRHSAIRYEPIANRQAAKGALVKVHPYNIFSPFSRLPLFCGGLLSVLSGGSSVEVCCGNLLFLFGHIIFCAGQVRRYNRGDDREEEDDDGK